MEKRLPDLEVKSRTVWWQRPHLASRYQYDLRGLECSSCTILLSQSQAWPECFQVIMRARVILTLAWQSLGRCSALVISCSMYESYLRGCGSQ